MNIHRPLYKTNNRHVEKPPQVALGKWHILDMTSRNFIIPVSNNVINLASQIHRKEHIEIFQTMKLKKRGISLIVEDQNIERNRNQHTKLFHIT